MRALDAAAAKLHLDDILDRRVVLEMNTEAARQVRAGTAPRVEDEVFVTFERGDDGSWQVPVTPDLIASLGAQ